MLTCTGNRCITYVDDVVERTVLRDGDERRLVVRRRVDRCEAVHASGETAGDGSREDAVRGLVVQALEEDELRRVRGGRLVERGERVDGDVRVAGDVTSSVDRLRGREVVRVRVREEASVEVTDRHLDGEVLVGGDGRAVLREHELGRGHVRLRRNDTHGRGVARTGRNLLAVRDRQVGQGRAEVDEVVRRRQRRNLAGGRLVLAIIREASGDDGADQRCNCSYSALCSTDVV